MPVFKIWNEWVEEGHKVCIAGSQFPTVTNNRKDKYLAYMALVDYATTSKALNQEEGSFLFLKKRSLHEQFNNI